MTTGIQLLTHSSMTCAKVCPRKYFYQYELGYRPARESTPLRLGSAYHLGLETIDTQDIHAACEAIRRSYADIPAWCQSEDDVEEWLVECETVLRLLMGHTWRWGQDGYQVIATELNFSLPLLHPVTGESHVSWGIAGKIDRIIQLPDGRLAVQEYKTTSDDIAPQSDYWRKLRIDQQISNYMLAARRLGYDVETVMYDVTRKPTIRPKFVGKGESKKRETPTEYGERLTADIGSRPDYYFARQEIPRLESDLAEFAAELWQIADWLSDTQQHSRWYRSTHACMSPYRCTYFDLCANGHSPDSGVPSGFVVKQNRHPELAEEASL